MDSTWKGHTVDTKVDLAQFGVSWLGTRVAGTCMICFESAVLKLGSSPLAWSGGERTVYIYVALCD